MLSAAKTPRRITAVISATVLTTVSATLLFTPAGFGGTWKRPVVSAQYAPIVNCTDPSITPGGTADLYVNTNQISLRRSGGLHNKIVGGGVTIQITSQPSGVVYTGTLSGTSGTLSVPVDPSTPLGTMTITVQTPDGSTGSTTATVAS